MFYIRSTYAQDISKFKEECKELFRKLQVIMKNISNNDRIMIIGDLNARIGDNEIPGIKQRFNESTWNENGELVDCARNELRNNTFFPHKMQVHV